MPEQLMTIREVAKYLNVTATTVLRLIERGELKASKVAARWRITPEEVEEYLARRRKDSD